MPYLQLTSYDTVSALFHLVTCSRKHALSSHLPTSCQSREFSLNYLTSSMAFPASIQVPNKGSQGRDVVSKGSFSIPLADTARTYARCHGRTQTGNIPLPRGRDTRHFGGWAVWEKEWERCICGGLWVKEVT